MSLGYADRLSHREDLGGRLGAPELFDRPADVVAKAGQLADMITAAGTMMAFTGAGISTSSGIPDFRGPQGIWTLQRAGAPLPSLATTFAAARPGLTHAALLGLVQAGRLVYICSQNVDSLHLRSGVPRAQLAELHGNCFAERCSRCGAEYVREFEMDTVGFKPTGRRCSVRGCGGPLADHILDWEDALPPQELAASERHASAVGLSLCLGTSLQIVPAANLPLRTLKSGGALAIINLQATPKDKRAGLVVHAKVDVVMSLVMQRLGIPLPTYTRTDHVLLSLTTSHNTTSSNGSDGSQAAGPSSNGEAGRRPRKGSAAVQALEAAAAARDPAGVPCEGGAITCPCCGRKVVVAATSRGSSSWGADLEAAAAAAGVAGAAGAAAQGNPATTSRSGGWSFEVVVGSPAGQPWPLPLVSAVRVVFSDPTPAGQAAAAAAEEGPGSSNRGPSTDSSGWGSMGLAPARVEGPAPFRIQRHVAGGGGSPPDLAQPTPPQAITAAAAGQGLQSEAVKVEDTAAAEGAGGEGGGVASGPCCVAVLVELELVAAAVDAERRYVEVPYLVVRDWSCGVTTPHPAGDTHTRLPGHLVPFTTQVIEYTPQQQRLVEEAMAAAAADPTPAPAPAPARGRSSQQKGRAGGQGAAAEEAVSSSEEEVSSDDDSGDSDYQGEALPSVSATRRGRAVRRPTKYARKQ